MPLKVKLRFGARGQEKVNGDQKDEVEEDVEIVSGESDSRDGSDLPELPEGLLQSQEIVCLFLKGGGKSCGIKFTNQKRKMSNYFIDIG